MKPLHLALTALSLVAAASAAQAGEVSQIEANARLAQVLTCQRSVSPDDFKLLVKQAGGKSVVQASDDSDGEYTVPNPLDVFGRPITQLSLHPGANGEGDFNEYTGVFSGESLQTVAKLGDVPKDDLGDFRKQVGNHDLILKAEHGGTYITCSQDVRTITKTIKRTAREASDRLNRAIQ